MQDKYNFTEIERRWQQTWKETNAFKVLGNPIRKSTMCLKCFLIPRKLHMGHVRNYSIGDVVARFKKMNGFNVLHPMGYDAFGLPAENAAIKNNVEPAKWTWGNIDEMNRQLRELGFPMTGTEKLQRLIHPITSGCSGFYSVPAKGLAYKKESSVNWCPSCQTVLANEQVLESTLSERCECSVGKRIFHSGISR